MRVLLQRVTSASVTVAQEVVGRIDAGLLLFVGAGTDDADADAEKLARKIAGLRVFPGEKGHFDRSVLEIGGEALVVSQFTLYGSCRKGRRPDFTAAAGPDPARALCERFAQSLEGEGVSHVARGRFGAHMEVALENDGPVTLWLDSAEIA